VALVTGDGDLIIGIEMAQKQGVRVALLGLEEPAASVSHNQSLEVVCTADRVCRIGRNSIAAFLHTTLATKKTKVPKSPAAATAAKAKKTAPTKKAAVSQKKPAATEKKTKAIANPKPPEPTVITAVSDEVLLKIIDSFIAKSVPPPDASSVTETGAIGPTVDGKLLQAATADLTRKPMPNERSRLRTLLRDRLLREPVQSLVSETGA
jgi:DNA-binding LacI/PurR family transcriptional regulator